MNCNSNGGNENSNVINARKFQRKCDNCSNKSYKEADCWHKDENAPKCQKKWKQKDARTKVNASNVEQLLVSVWALQSFNQWVERNP